MYPRILNWIQMMISAKYLVLVLLKLVRENVVLLVCYSIHA